MMITALEATLAASGIVALILALYAVRLSIRERTALLRLGRNGELAVLANHHLMCATIRGVAGAVSVIGGVALLRLPNHADTASLIAKGVWLMYVWLMIVNLLLERRANHLVDHYADPTGAHDRP